MEQIRGYLLSVVAVAMLSVLLLSLVKQEQLRRILRFVTGLLVLLTVLSPLLKLDEDFVLRVAEELELSIQGNIDALDGQVNRELARHVQDTTEKYIEQKAEEIGANIQAKVTVTEEKYPIPFSVEIIGTLTPQQREGLKQYLTLSLGISAERQEWK